MSIIIWSYGLPEVNSSLYLSSTGWFFHPRISSLSPSHPHSCLAARRRGDARGVAGVFVTGALLLSDTLSVMTTALFPRVPLDTGALSRMDKLVPRCLTRCLSMYVKSM